MSIFRLTCGNEKAIDGLLERRNCILLFLPFLRKCLKKIQTQRLHKVSKKNLWMPFTFS